MSCSSASPRLSVLLVLLVYRSVSVTDAGSFPSLTDPDLPWLDGSAVDSCRIFPLTTPAAAPIAMAASSTTSRERQLATTRKPAAPLPSTKAAVKKPPIRKQLAPQRPNTGSHADSAAQLLHYILAASRGHTGGSLPRPSSSISQPIDSDSDEGPPPRRAGRTGGRSPSSEDSSDE